MQEISINVLSIKVPVPLTSSLNGNMNRSLQRGVQVLNQHGTTETGLREMKKRHKEVCKKRTQEAIVCGGNNFFIVGRGPDLT